MPDRLSSFWIHQKLPDSFNDVRAKCTDVTHEESYWDRDKDHPLISGYEAPRFLETNTKAGSQQHC